MANRYWVGGTGSWSDTSHWSTTSGGAGGASVPTSVDDVFINTTSGPSTQVITISSPAEFQTLNTIGFTGTINLNSVLSAWGNIANGTSTLVGPTWTSSLGTGELTIKNNCTITGPKTYPFRVSMGTDNITLTISGAITAADPTITVNEFYSNMPTTRLSSVSGGRLSIINNVIFDSNAVDCYTNGMQFLYLTPSGTPCKFQAPGTQFTMRNNVTIGYSSLGSARDIYFLGGMTLTTATISAYATRVFAEGFNLRITTGTVNIEDNTSVGGTRWGTIEIISGTLWVAATLIKCINLIVNGSVVIGGSSFGNYIDVSGNAIFNGTVGFSTFSRVTLQLTGNGRCEFNNSTSAALSVDMNLTINGYYTMFGYLQLNALASGTAELRVNRFTRADRFSLLASGVCNFYGMHRIRFSGRQSATSFNVWIAWTGSYIMDEFFQGSPSYPCSVLQTAGTLVFTSADVKTAQYVRLKGINTGGNLKVISGSNLGGNSPQIMWNQIGYLIRQNIQTSPTNLTFGNSVGSTDPSFVNLVSSL